MNQPTLLQLYPPSAEHTPLKGLYLRHNLLNKGDVSHPYVYSNYITSLDGRIAMEHPDTGKYGPPSSITNGRDWRLFQELAAQADVIVVSGRYLRELQAGTAQANLPVSNTDGFEDLMPWRIENGLTPQPAIAIISASLDIPFTEIFKDSNRLGLVITGENADPDKVAVIEAAGGIVLKTNPGTTVTGQAMINALSKAGYARIYAVAGPLLLETLLREHALNRLYLTHAQQILGGQPYDSLFEGKALQPATKLQLISLFYDDNPSQDDSPRQQFACYDLKPDSSAF